MPFLISKDGLDTLIDNGKDHGLDCHLRVIFGTRWEHVQPLVDILKHFNIAQEINEPNPRTGRIVRGYELLAKPMLGENEEVIHELMKNAVQRRNISNN